MSSTYSSSSTYTTADVESVFRRFRADIFMIADSTGAVTRAKAEDYAHDAEYLAVRGYLKKIDLTLLDNGVEVCAAVYHVNEKAGGVAASRPGGVLWPKVSKPFLRIVLSYTDAYTDTVKQQTLPKLKIGWVKSTDDTSHAALKKSGGRPYTSNAFGLDRDDYS